MPPERRPRNPVSSVPVPASACTTLLLTRSNTALSDAGLGARKIGARKHDPQFRQRVLTACEYRAASACGWGRSPSPWTRRTSAGTRRAAPPGGQRAGPLRAAPQGLQPGRLHPRPRGVLLVSDLAPGTAGFEETLPRHQGKGVHPPRPDFKPEAAFLGWHGREVFKGAARHLVLRCLSVAAAVTRPAAAAACGWPASPARAAACRFERPALPVSRRGDLGVVGVRLTQQASSANRGFTGYAKGEGAPGACGHAGTERAGRLRSVADLWAKCPQEPERQR